MLPPFMGRNIEEILSAQKKDSNIVSIDGLEGLKVKVTR
jgi:HlyD family secretion protein